MSTNWIDVSEQLPLRENEVCYLVAYLNPFFGKLTLEITLASFDSPNDYENPEDAEGWKDCCTGKKILVTHWQKLPNLPHSEFDGIDQLKFKNQFGTIRPKLGCVTRVDTPAI
jgi:hypothetical protein